MFALTGVDFNQLHIYIKANYGINLSEKKQLTVSCLSNMLASRGYRSFSEYVDEIPTGRDKEVVVSIPNKLTTSYTYFPRRETHFQFLQNTILPDLTKKHTWDKTLSIWNAGCFSREEPYTIPTYLKEFFGSQANSWNIRVLAADISQQVLNKARNPVYWEENLERLSSSWKQKYFVKSKDNTYTIAPVIKWDVAFQTFNPMNFIRFRRPFDLVFCRSVMIYSDQATRDAPIQRSYDAIALGSYLLIDHSEDLNKATCPYEYLIPAIYQKTRRRFV